MKDNIIAILWMIAQPAMHVLIAVMYGIVIVLRMMTAIVRGVKRSLKENDG